MKTSRIAAVGPFLLFAGRRSAAVPCASSALVAPSVVEDTAGALGLAEAVDCSDGAFEVSWVGSVAVEQTIRVPDGTVLSIEGLPDGSSIADGAGEVRLFQVDRGALQLSGLSLVNGTSTVGGSIFAFDSVVTATECEFTGNAASEGGAIYALDSVVNATDCEFTRNVAGSGGGFFGWGSLLQLHKCEFAHNSADFGGAINLFSGSVVHASESVFTKNNASSDGGGVHAGSSELNADNCSFSYNSAENGGAVRVYNTSAVHASRTVFTHNIALNYGGSTQMDNNSVLTLDDCSLSYNNASIGGAVFGSSAEVFVSGNSVFEENIAVTSGGGVFLSFSHLEVPVNDGGALFSGNRVEGAGAGVYVTLSTVHLEGPTVFTNNIAGATGGGMYLQGAYDLRVENARFSSNSAQTNGGAMTLVSPGEAGEFAQIFNSSFGENVAGNTGGAVYIAGGFVDFNQSFFEGNTAGRPRKNGQHTYTRYRVSSALPDARTYLLWLALERGPSTPSPLSVFLSKRPPLDIP